MTIKTITETHPQGLVRKEKTWPTKRSSVRSLFATTNETHLPQQTKIISEFGWMYLFVFVICSVKIQTVTNHFRFFLDSQKSAQDVNITENLVTM